MKFCSNCGNSLETNSKFCSNCGKQILISENKIDKSYEYLKSNVQMVKDEIDNSNVINDIKANATKVITEEIPNVAKKITLKIVDILGIVGLVIILIQIFAYFITGEVSHFDEAYFNWKSYRSYDNLSFFSIFIAQILPTTILPFVFMFWSGLRKKWLLNVTCILIILIFIIRDLNSERVIKYEESETNYRDSIQKVRINQFENSN